MPSGAGLVFMSEKLLVAYWGKRHASYVNNIVMHVNSKETRYNIQQTDDN